MKEGDVALAPLPQADGQTKNRPVILLREMPPGWDFLVCGLSTQIRQRVPAFDDIISPDDADFRSSGLVVQSLIRLGFLAIVPKDRLAGAIGAISTERHSQLLRTLGEYLTEKL
jgi:mRNA interferase MazF